jgi:hypothetical protein
LEEKEAFLKRAQLVVKIIKGRSHRNEVVHKNENECLKRIPKLA